MRSAGWQTMPSTLCEKTVPGRTIHCDDAIRWLSAREVLEECSVITSLPDVSETRFDLPAWQSWFVYAAKLVISRVPRDGVAIFFQTDIKRDGAWVDKGYLCLKAAEVDGARLLWHKIACRFAPGSTTFGRPSYSHLLCFSKGVIADPARSTPDVLPEVGKMTWSRAMGLSACLFACRYVLEQTITRTIVDPFCGNGSVLAVANELGMDAIGVDISHRRCRRASMLETAVLRQGRRSQPGRP